MLTRALLAQRSALYTECYQLGHHVVRRFDIMGIVVGFESKSNPSGGHRLLFALDDGSAVVNCLVWRDSSAARDRDLQELPLGTLLRAKGRMKTFRGQRQLTAWHISAERDPLAEPLRWLELERLWRDVYSVDPRPATAAIVDVSRRGDRGGSSADGGVWRAATTGGAQQVEVHAVRLAIESLVGLPTSVPLPAAPPLSSEAGPLVSPAGGPQPDVPPPHEMNDSGETMPDTGEARGAPSYTAAGAQPAAAHSFSYPSLLLEDNPVFQQALRCASAGTGSGACDSIQRHAAAKSLVLRAVQGLKADGAIELVDADADVYARFDPEVQLMPAILRHASRASAWRDGSITLAQLRTELQQHERHAFAVSDATLRTALEVLIERSQLYETERDTFRIVA